MKWKYQILFILFCQQNLWAQVLPRDSIKKVQQLQEVVVSGQNESENQSFNFYRSNKLANTDEILSRMQGVNLIRRGAYGAEPTIRNYGAGQTNLTIDGMRIYGACTDKMDPVSVYVEPINLQSIQVSHGSAGAQYGSAIGGQINLKLKEADFSCHKKTSGQFAQSFSTVNMGINTAFNLSQSMNRFAYKVNGAFRKAEDYKAGSNTLINYSGFQKSNLSAMLAYRIDSSQTIKIDYLGDWGKNIGYPALPMDVGKAVAQIYSITHRYKGKGKLLQSNESKLYYNAIFHSMDDTHRPDAPMHMDMPGWSNTAGFYNELNFKNNLAIRVDGHYVYTKAEMTMYPVGEPVMYMQTLPENNLLDLGIYIGKTFSLKHRQQLIFSTRLDVFDQSAMQGPGATEWTVFNKDVTVKKTDVLKNVNLAYAKYFDSRTFMRLSTGYSERLATSNERYGYYLFNRQDQFDYLGNMDLAPEKALQAELMFQQEFKKFTYSFNLFYHHTNDYIYAYQLDGYSQMTIGALGLKTYRNIYYAVSRGFEANVKWNILDQLSYLAMGKYVFAETYSGVPLPLVPPFKLQEALRYTYKLFQFQLEHDYASAQNRVNVDYGDKVTPSFNLFNLRASRNFRIKSTVLQFGIACENILDKTYWEHLDIGQVPRPGRNFLFNLNFLF